MNKTIRRASVFALLLVFALLIRATWVQFYEGQALADDKDNRRNVIETYSSIAAWERDCRQHVPNFQRAVTPAAVQRA